MKLCKDCVHMDHQNWCMHPSVVFLQINYVDGKERPVGDTCNSVRQDSDRCGHDAKLFVQRRDWV